MRRRLVVIAVLGAAAGVGLLAAGRVEGQVPGTTPPSPVTSAPPATPQRVRVAVSQVEPFVVKQGDRYMGFSVDLWNEIALRNGYQTEYVEAPGVDEQLDLVRSGRADVAIGAVDITSDRLRTLGFSVPTFDGGLQIVVPTSHATSLETLIGTLTDSAVVRLFLLLLGSAVVAAIIVWLVERRHNPDFGPGAPKGMWEGLWWAVVTMLTVGYGDRVTRTNLGRIFSVAFMVFGVVLVAQLTATFSASLNREQAKSTVRGPEDLLGHSIVTVKDSEGARYLREHHVPATEVGGESEMIQAVADGHFDAGVHDSATLAYQVNQFGRGRLRLEGGPFTRNFYSIAVPPASELQTAVNQAIVSADADGTYDRIARSWFGR